MIFCRTSCLENRNGHTYPQKAYLIPSFTEYLACLLSNPEAERLCDQACDDTMHKLNSGVAIVDVKSVFEADFLQNLKGPTPGQLFSLIEATTFDLPSSFRWTFSAQMAQQTAALIQLGSLLVLLLTYPRPCGTNPNIYILL